jgi:arsenate reductase
MPAKPAPVFFGASEKLHRGFEDPAAFKGSNEERLALFRRVRDELRSWLREFDEAISY